MAADVVDVQVGTSLEDKITGIAAAIVKTEAEIADVNGRIPLAETELATLEKEQSQPNLSEDKMTRLDEKIRFQRETVQQLREEKQQLREEKQQLREEKQQLREKELLLLRIAHPNAKDSERERDQQQGESASKRSASFKSTVWWPACWPSLWPVRGGEDSRQLQQQLHGECDVSASIVPNSTPSSSGAASQHLSTCRHRRLHGAGQQASAGVSATARH
ncbi:hypothetical protein HYH02_005340 [Chlamydomonas schloesseri]|uniref:Uncharacterized protein n=1 Tax=Chlamydomonas schloesseri TaxID=2026947 RepID=A0A835WLI3_9CHLO|nr:hypothetical protein HYH02_005340 [Chlamydomonas schloesseri]|eukprot:KAG2449817.1 hypothetical protein HYH02_005340 [Chlamydomonas schloesseri]